MTHGVGPGARTIAPEAVDQVLALAAVETRAALAFVDLELAVGPVETGQTCTHVAVDGLCAQSLAGHARVRVTVVDETFTVGARVARQAVAANAQRRLVAHAAVETYAQRAQVDHVFTVDARKARRTRT